MRLIRIVSTTETKASITNLFSDDIVLKPHSRIALALASINLTGNTIAIDNDSNTLTFQLGATNAPQQVVLPTGTFEESTFIKLLNTAFNSALNVNSNQYNGGFQWKCIYTMNFKLNVQFARIDYLLPDYPDKTASLTYDEPNKGYTKTTATNAWDAYAGTEKIWIQGCGRYTCYPIDTVGGGLVIFAFGLVNERVDISSGTLEPGNFAYAITCPNGLTYFTVIDGIATDTGHNYMGGDKIELLLSGGNLIFNVYRPATPDDAVELGITQWTFNMQSGFYPAFSIQQHNIALQNIKAHLDPYQITTLSGVTLLDELPNDNNLVEYGAVGAVKAIKIILNLPNLINKVFGYRLSSYDMVKKTGGFKAEDNLQKVTDSPSIIVEATNLTSLQSFDGKSGCRRSIISVIPSLNIGNDNSIIFQPSQYIFVDINNAFDTRLNQLQIRLLDNADEEVLSLGSKGCSLLFVIQ